MHAKYKACNPDGIYFLALTVLEWADVFARRNYSALVCDSLYYCQKKKERTLYAWCIRTNPIHLICSSPKLTDVLRNLKKYMSRHTVEAISTKP